MIGGRNYVSGAFTLSSYSSGAHHYKVCRSNDTTGWGGCNVVMTTYSGSSFTVSGSNLPTNGYRRAYYFSACDAANDCTRWADNPEVYVQMDTTGPTAPGPSTTACLYQSSGCWVTGAFTVSVSPASDSGSGVNPYGYRFCRSEDSTGGFAGCERDMTLTAGTSFTVSGSNLPSDGYRRAYYAQAKDYLGNKGSWNTPLYVRVDRYNPTVSANNASSSWFTSRTATISAADATGGAAANSGLKEVRYRWNAAHNGSCTTGTVTSSGATLTVPEGDNRLYLCAKDNTGRVGFWNGTYRVDSTGPAASGPTTTACKYQSSGCWVTGAFTVTVTAATDSGSGVNPTAYRHCRSQDSTGGFAGCQANMTTTGTTSFTVSGSNLPSDGYRRAYWVQAKDYAGNKGTWNTPLYVRVDRHNPTVSANNASETWFASRTVTVSAADAAGGAAANSGLKEVRYRWNAAHNGSCTTGTVTSDGATLTVPAGDNHLYLCAKDNTGRVGFWNGGPYRVDSSAPVRTSLAVSSNEWVINNGSAYTITAQVSDAGSGVRELRTLINHQGSNSANPRGNFSWRDQSLGYLWSADQVPCAGGGFASKRPDAFNPGTINLVGCVTSLSGSLRTVTFTVMPNDTFGEFGPINDISFWTRDFVLNATNWANWDLNFSSVRKDPPKLVVSHAGTPLGHGGTVAWGTVDQHSGAGDLLSKDLVVANGAAAGASDLLLVHSPSNVEVVNTEGSAFSWAGTLVSPLAPGQSDAFHVRLSTAQAGTFAAVVKIWHNDGGRPNPLRVNVTGTVRAPDPPQLVVSNGTNPPLADNDLLDWGTVDLHSGTNDILGKNMVVKNAAAAGASDLVLVHSPSNVEVVNTLGNAFTWAGTLVSPLAPGASDNFAVRLSTAVAGTYAAVVKIWHNDPARPNPFQLNVAGRVMDPAAGDPEILSLSPNKVTNGGKTTVTVTGTNLTSAEVSVATGTPPEGAQSRSFPTARLLSVNADGTQMQVEIDATSTQIEDFHNLVVESAGGEDAEPFRVLPQGPVVDLWSPGEPEVGATYLMAIIGANLQGATVSATRGEILSLFNSADDRLSGRYRAPATAGPAELVVTAGGVEVRLPINVVGAGQSTALSQDLTEGLRLKHGSEGGKIPRILMQAPVFTERAGLTGLEPTELVPLDAEALEPAASGAGTGSASAAEAAEKLALLLFYLRFKLVEFHHREAILFDPETLAEGDAILQGLGLGDQVRIGGLVLSFYMRVDLTITWWWDFFSGFTYPIFCLTATFAAEVPGTPGFAIQLDYCVGLGGAANTSGTLSDTTFTGGPCAEVVDEGPPVEGQGFATVTLTDCCEQPISLSATGSTFDGFYFAESFTITNPEAGQARPAPMCGPGPCEVTLSQPAACVLEAKTQVYRASGSPSGGQYFWDIPQGGDRASISGSAQGEAVSVRGETPSGSKDDAMLRVTYTAPDGGSCEAQTPFTVIRLSNPFFFHNSGTADLENDKRDLFPDIGFPRLGSSTPGNSTAIGYHKNEELRVTVTPCDSTLQCSFNFVRAREGRAIRYLDGTATPVPGHDCPVGPCPDELPNNLDEDLTIDPGNCAIYSLDGPGVQTGGTSCSTEGLIDYTCMNFTEFIKMDSAQSDLRLWSASTRIRCANGTWALDGSADNTLQGIHRDCEFNAPQAVVASPEPKLLSPLAIIAGLRSEDGVERINAYRAASPATRKTALSPAEREDLIRDLVLLAQETESSYPMQSTPVLAMRLLAEYGAVEAVPVLLDRINDPFPRFISETADLLPEAAKALRAIGAPAIGPILDRVETASGEEWATLSLVLRLMDDQASVLQAVGSRMGQVDTPAERARLEALMNR